MKLERLLKEKDREAKEELDDRMKDMRERYEADIEKLKDHIVKVECECQALAHASKH